MDDFLSFIVGLFLFLLGVCCLFPIYLGQWGDEEERKKLGGIESIFALIFAIILFVHANEILLQIFR